MMGLISRKLAWILAYMAIVTALNDSAVGQVSIRSRDVQPGVRDDRAATPLPGGSPARTAYVPSWNSQPNAWRLGVGIENLQTGVLLTDVERGLPAERAGLAAGDVIINVEGYQVGYAEGSLYDLGDEINRRIDALGNIDFLVFDKRNRQLRSMPVKLVQQSTAGVRGQVVCRERITLTPQATLTVRLRDVTYSSWQNVEVGKHVIPNPPHPPIPFSIQVDPASLYPDHRYAIDAWLVDRGQIVLQSTAPTPVTPTAGPAPLHVALVRVGASVPPNTTYAVGQFEQITQWYRQYLGRDARSDELTAWQGHLQAGRSPQDILAYILSSSEYYDRTGNQRDPYLTALYRSVNGQQPTATDLAELVQQYQNYDGSRNQFVRDVLRLQ